MPLIDPNKPKPIITQDSPKRKSAWRTPCIDIAPRVLYAASFKLVLGSNLTQRFMGPKQFLHGWHSLHLHRPLYRQLQMQ